MLVELSKCAQRPQVVNLHNKQTKLSHADWSKTQPGPKQSLVTRHMCQALQHVCGLHHGFAKMLVHMLQMLHHVRSCTSAACL